MSKDNKDNQSSGTRVVAIDTTPGITTINNFSIASEASGEYLTFEVTAEQMATLTITGATIIRVEKLNANTPDMELVGTNPNLDAE